MRVDKELINTINKSDVLSIIRNRGPINRAEISKITGLSIPTIMKLADEFIRNGLVRETGKRASTGGKPPKLLKLISNSHYIVGVDVGTTHIEVIMMDLSASIVSKFVKPTKANAAPENVVSNIIHMIKVAIDQSNIDVQKILGIGIGIPGILDLANGKVLYSPDLNWENVDIVLPIKREFGLPVMMDNVTRCMAVGEKLFGVGKQFGNFMCINLGYGIGSAVIIEDELYRGNTGTSGEFGHTTMEKDGPLCDCGNHGCLEALSSANAIAKAAKKEVLSRPSLIMDLAERDVNKIEAKTVFDAAKQGDALATEIVNAALNYLGTAIAGAINLLDPQAVILEGGMSRAGDILLSKVKQAVKQRQMKYTGSKTEILISQLEDAAAVGAAALIVNKFLNNGGYSLT